MRGQVPRLGGRRADEQEPARGVPCARSA
jgi:hypothetical protein